MPVKDNAVYDQIDRIADRVDTILNNAFVRKALSRIDLPHEFRGGMDMLMARAESGRIVGYLFEELYRGILGLAIWTYKARTEFLPNMKFHLSHETLSQSELLREQMAAENLKSNLAILADEINDLYVVVVKHDKESHQRKEPVYTRIPELRDIGKYLTSNEKGLLR